MPPKNNRNTRKTRNPRPTNSPIPVRFKVNFTHTTSATQAMSLIVLGFGGESTVGTTLLPTVSTLMLDYQQMYRYARIKRASIEVRAGPSFTEPEGGVILAWVPRESSTAPADYTNSEGMFQVPIILHPEGNQVKNKLTINTNNITGLAGKEGWITTTSLADTGIDEYFTNYGAIFLLSNANFTTTQTMLCSLYVDMEFKTIYDPDVLLRTRKTSSDDLTKEEQLLILKHRNKPLPLIPTDGKSCDKIFSQDCSCPHCR